MTTKRTPLAWSFSALSDFENCPKAFFHKRVIKDVREEMGVEAKWGDDVHKYLEASILLRNQDKASAAEVIATLIGWDEGRYNMYSAYVDAVFSVPHDIVYPERQYAIDTRLQPCGWYDKGVWCRGIIDVLIIKGNKAYAIDWKTGKRKPNSRQLMLFALLVFLHHPEIQSVKTEFVWLKTGERDSETYHRHQEGELWAQFTASLATYRLAFRNDSFPPRTSGLCRGWCPVTSCPHWSPKKGR